MTHLKLTFTVILILTSFLGSVLIKIKVLDPKSPKFDKQPKIPDTLGRCVPSHAIESESGKLYIQRFVLGGQPPKFNPV